MLSLDKISTSQNQRLHKEKQINAKVKHQLCEGHRNKTESITIHIHLHPHPTELRPSKRAIYTFGAAIGSTRQHNTCVVMWVGHIMSLYFWLLPPSQVPESPCSVHDVLVHEETLQAGAECIHVALYMWECVGVLFFSMLRAARFSYIHIKMQDFLFFFFVR